MKSRLLIDSIASSIFLSFQNPQRAKHRTRTVIQCNHYHKTYLLPSQRNMKSKYISVPKKEYEELQSQLKEKERLLSQLKAILKEVVTDNDVLCTICLEKLQNPCILPDCLHRFCKDCLHDSILLCSTKCPACRKRISNRREGLHEDKPFQRVVCKKIYLEN